MVEDILQRYLNTDPDELYMVGDSLRDLQAIEAVGGQPVLVLTGKGEKTLRDPALPEDTIVYHDLLEFAQAMLHNHQKRQAAQAEQEE